MNDCGAKSKLSAPLIYLFHLSKTGNYSVICNYIIKLGGRRITRRDGGPTLERLAAPGHRALICGELVEFSNHLIDLRAGGEAFLQDRVGNVLHHYGVDEFNLSIRSRSRVRLTCEVSDAGC